MFGFLFGRKKEESSGVAAAPSEIPQKPAPQGAAPGTHIPYSPGLIEELKDDHQMLLKIFGDIRAAHAAGNFSGVAPLLEKFRSALAGHLLKENVRFYIYLEHALEKDESSHALVHQFRHEMDGIGKAVLAFLDRYRNIGSDAALAVSFGADLASVGKVLVARISNEESTLYPLYLPAY